MNSIEPAVLADIMHAFGVAQFYDFELMTVRHAPRCAGRPRSCAGGGFALMGKQARQSTQKRLRTAHTARSASRSSPTPPQPARHTTGCCQVHQGERQELQRRRARQDAVELWPVRLPGRGARRPDARHRRHAAEQLQQVRAAGLATAEPWRLMCACPLMMDMRSTVCTRRVGATS